MQGNKRSMWRTWTRMWNTMYTCSLCKVDSIPSCLLHGVIVFWAVQCTSAGGCYSIDDWGPLKLQGDNWCVEDWRGNNWCTWWGIQTNTILVNCLCFNSCQLFGHHVWWLGIESLLTSPSCFATGRLDSLALCSQGKCSHSSPSTYRCWCRCQCRGQGDWLFVLESELL